MWRKILEWLYIIEPEPIAVGQYYKMRKFVVSLSKSVNNSYALTMHTYVIVSKVYHDEIWVDMIIGAGYRMKYPIKRMYSFKQFRSIFELTTAKVVDKIK